MLSLRGAVIPDRYIYGRFVLCADSSYLKVYFVQTGPVINGAVHYCVHHLSRFSVMYHLCFKGVVEICASIAFESVVGKGTTCTVFYELFLI